MYVVKNPNVHTLNSKTDAVNVLYADEKLISISIA
jgi:hypothetical protein